MSMIQYTSDYDDFYIASLTDAMEQYAAAEFIITEIRQYLNTKNIPYITENSYEKRIKLLLTLIVGFAVAMLIMGIFIYFGYTKVYETAVGIVYCKNPWIAYLPGDKNRGAYVNKIISVRRIVYDNKWHSTTNAFQRI